MRSRCGCRADARSSGWCSSGAGASASTRRSTIPRSNPEIARRIGINAGLWVPLLVRERAIGVIMVVDRVGDDPRFSDEDLRLAEVFASRAAVAVEMSERVARDALRRVVAAQELERRRLSRELHDETGQTLTSVCSGCKRSPRRPTPSGPMPKPSSCASS